MAATVYEGLRIRKLADRSTGERKPLLRIDPTRVQIDEATGKLFVDAEDVERILFNPDTPELEHEPWPLLGIAFEGDAPKRARVPTSTVARGQAEGWLTLEDATMVHRPGGPAGDPWRVTHSFQHGSAVVFHTVDGDVRYRIVENPDKWPAEKDGDLGFGGDVRWFYDLERADG